MRQHVLRATTAVLAIATWTLVGCGTGGELDPLNKKYVTETRKTHGLVIILPGIEGISQANINVRKGLLQAGVRKAIMIYSWNRPGVIVNQVDFVGNRIAGAFVARVVKQYQDLYPGKPVHIIGHSGGGGIAVFAAESMGNEGKVDGLVLLAASISKNYDLTKALRNTRDGVVNFYNPSDSALLGAGTTLMGTVDGDHAPAAGLNGFERSFPGLVQRRVSSAGGDPHYAATKPWFVASHVAPLVQGGGDVTLDRTGEAQPHARR
jgi:pimeloyl-ACP methyl ester carboxylesterase